MSVLDVTILVVGTVALIAMLFIYLESRKGR